MWFCLYADIHTILSNDIPKCGVEQTDVRCLPRQGTTLPPHSQAHTYIDTTAIQKDDLEKSTHPFCTPTGGVNQVDTNSLISGCETLTSSRFEAVAGVFRVQVESERSTTHSDRSPLPLSHWACSTHLAYVMHTCTHSHTHAPTHKKR